MAFTTDLFRYLYQLSSSIYIEDDATGDAPDSVLAAQLVAVTADLRLTVSSYLGLQLTIIDHGQPITLTAIMSEQPALTFLRLPLDALGGGFEPESRVIFYAAAPGGSSTSPPTSATPSTSPPPPTRSPPAPTALPGPQTATANPTAIRVAICRSSLMPICRRALWNQGYRDWTSGRPSTERSGS